MLKATGAESPPPPFPSHNPVRLGPGAWPGRALARQGRQHDSLLLGAVCGGVALGGAGALGAADVAELEARVLERVGDAALHGVPGAHVARLLLDPDELLEVRVALDELAELGLGE